MQPMTPVIPMKTKARSNRWPLITRFIRAETLAFVRFVSLTVALCFSGILNAMSQ